MRKRSDGDTPTERIERISARLRAGAALRAPARPRAPRCGCGHLALDHTVHSRRCTLCPCGAFAEVDR